MKYFSGAYAEAIVTESIYVFPLHQRLSFAQGAALGVPYFTAYKALIMGAKVWNMKVSSFQKFELSCFFTQNIQIQTPETEIDKCLKNFLAV